MIQLIAQTFLSRYLQPFIHGFSRQNIDVQLLAGKVTISNVILKQDIFTNLNLPILVPYSYVEKIELIIPWRENEVTFTLNISNVYALITPNDKLDLYSIMMASKKSIIKNVIQQFKEKSMKKAQGKSMARTYVQNFLNKLLDNIEVNVGTVHFRYQSPDDGYSFGFLLQNAFMSTVDKEDKKKFFNRQNSQQCKVKYVARIDFLGIYLNSKEKTANMISRFKQSYAEMTQRFKPLSTIDSRNEQSNLNFILKLSIRTEMYKFIKQLAKEKQRNLNTPLFQCNINLDEINLDFTHQQLNDIMDIVNYFLGYRNLWNQYLGIVQRNPINPSQEVWQTIFKKYQRKSVFTAKEEEMIRKYSQKLIGWVFKSVYVDKLRKRFLQQAIANDITVTNLFANKKIKAIIRKINSQTLKQWVSIALKTRAQYQAQTNAVLRISQYQVNSYFKKTISKHQLFHKYEQDEQDEAKEVTNERQILFQLHVKLKTVKVQAFKQGIFGIGFQLQNLLLGLDVRIKNIFLELAIKNFKGYVFSFDKNQTSIYRSKRTIVPVVKRSILHEDDHENLLYICFEKDPFGEPLIYTKTKVQIKSIQVFLYPQAFRQFYEIVFLQAKSDKEQVVNRRAHGRQKKAQSVKTSILQSYGIQRNIIIGKMSSPWIILPLAQSNDRNSQCWVFRLGDFSVHTPQYELSTSDQELYYEHFKLQLSRFDIKYFSSIQYFHIWLKYNQSISSQRPNLKIFDQEKFIQVVSPISCHADIMIRKQFVSDYIKEKKQAFIASISIDEVEVTLSKFILNKMKQRYDLLGKAGQSQFVQYNIKNLIESSQLQGYAQITYEKLTKMKLYIIIKGNYAYFFLTEKSEKYYFYLDLREHYVKVISDHISIHNQQKTKKISIFVQSNMHSYWEKYLSRISKFYDRKKNNQYEQKQQFPGFSFFHQGQRNSTQEIEKEKIKKQIQSVEVSSSLTKVSLGFSMSKLVIKLIEEDKELLTCKFGESFLNFKQMKKRQISFSIRDWYVFQPGQDQAFFSSTRFFNSQKEEITQANNFLEVLVDFSEVTNQLQTINVAIEKFFIAWKVDTFTKILIFFFYPEEFGDVPAASSSQKREININFKIKNLSIYCYQEDNIIGLFKLQNATVRFEQSNIQQLYILSCDKLYTDKFIGNRMDDAVPMILCKQNKQNVLHLEYRIRKDKIQAFPNVKKYKEMFGNDTIVTQLTTTFGDSIIYYQHEQFMRLLNYFLNKILGHVAAKFRKRNYSESFIYETLKIKKVGIINVKFKNITLLIPPIDRETNLFQLDISQVQLTKNLKPAYLPVIQMISTKIQPVPVFKQSMVFQVKNLFLNHKSGSQPLQPLMKQPINALISYTKFRFSSEHYPVLKNPQHDIDRTIWMTLSVQDVIDAELYKISFITFLQIFYQNIKHKDGKAHLFEPPSPYPQKRQILLSVDELNFNLYEEVQRKMVVFNRYQVDTLHIHLKMEGPVTTIKLSGDRVQGNMQLPLRPLYNEDQLGRLSNTSEDIDKYPKLSIEVMTKQGLMQVKVFPQNYHVQVNLDKLQNLMSYIKYNSDFVSNPYSPKKKSSKQLITMYPKNCMVKIGEVQALGSFYIVYGKNVGEQISSQARQFLGNNCTNIDDRLLKVNGNNVQMFIQGDPVGSLSSIYYHRLGFYSKQLHKQFRRQTIQLGQSGGYLQFPDLLTLYGVFKKHIQKNQKEQKSFYQPWNSIPDTPKTEIKRIMEIEVSKSSIFLMPSAQNQKNYLPHLEIQVYIPKMFYATHLNQQHLKIQVGVLVKQLGKRMAYQGILYAKDLRLHYINIKDKHEKSLSIQNAKHIKLFMEMIDTQSLARLICDIKSNPFNKPRKIYGKTATLNVINETTQRLNLQLKSSKNNLLQLFQQQTSSRPSFQFFPTQIQMKKSKIGSFEIKPLHLLQLFNLKSKASLKGEQRTFQQINQYGNVAGINILVESTKKGINIRLTSNCVILNMCQFPITLENGHTLQKKEQSSLYSRAYFQVTIFQKKQSIYLRSGIHYLFNGLVQAVIISFPSYYQIQLNSKYIIQNMLPIPLQINSLKINPFQKKLLLMVNGQDLQATKLEIDSNRSKLFLLNLQNPLQQVTWKSQGITYNCKIKRKINEKFQNKITLYPKFLFHNRSLHKSFYKFNENTQQTFILESGQYFMPATHCDKIIFSEKRQHGSLVEKINLKYLEKKSISTILYEGKILLIQEHTKNGNFFRMEDLVQIDNKINFGIEFNSLKEQFFISKFSKEAIHISQYYEQALDKLNTQKKKKDQKFKRNLEVQINFREKSPRNSRSMKFDDDDQQFMIPREDTIPKPITFVPQIGLFKQKISSQGVDKKTKSKIMDQITEQNGKLILPLIQDVHYIQIKQQIIQIKVLQINSLLRISFCSSADEPNIKGYTFNNELPDFAVILTQKYSKKQTILKPNSTTQIGFSEYTNLTKNKIFFLTFYYESKNIDFESYYTIDLNTINQRDYVEQFQINEKGQVFKFAIAAQKSHDGQILFTIMRNRSYQIMLDKVEKLQVKAKQLGFFVQLDNSDSMAFELCGLQFKRQKQGSIIERTQLKIQNLLLRQGKNQTIVKFLSSSKNIIDAYMIRKKVFQGKKFKFLRLSMGDLDLHPRQEMVNKILKFISKTKRKMKVLEGSKQNLQIIPFLEKAIEEELKVANKVAKAKSALLIEELRLLDPFHIYLSYSKDEFSDYEEIKDDPILKYFMLVPEISEVKLNIPRLQLKNFQGSGAQLLKELMKQMKSSLPSVIFSLISSIGLLDNPLQFSQNLIRYMAGLKMILSS